MARENIKAQQENEKFKVETRGAIQSLGGQIAQLTAAVTKLEKKQRILPPQVEVNQPTNANAVALRSRKELPEKVFMPKLDEKVVEVEDLIDQVDQEEAGQEKEEVARTPDEGREVTKKPIYVKHNPKVLPPFPGRLVQNRKDKELSEMYRVFKKVEINIPLITAPGTMPRCAKFMKELYTKKVKYKDDAKFLVGENVSAVLKWKLPKKCGDPGIFFIPCIIGETRIEKAMLDLGASINVMPLALFYELQVGPLKPTRMVIQLADKSNVYPEGIIEDVLIKVEDLIFPADFYVLDMGMTGTKSSIMLLGCPFMKTARKRIDCDSGRLANLMAFQHLQSNGPPR